jgi:hypothetical protein
VTDETLKLFWRDQLVGTITGARWSDFPWVSGTLTITQLSPNIRTALEYVAAQVDTEEGLTDWPFAEDLGYHWQIVRPDGTAKEVSLPIVDFSTGHVEWR